jgi:hypothetical protein
MDTFLNPAGFAHTDRRSVLRSLAGFGFALKLRETETKADPAYRFSTPHGEVDMAVQYFDNSSLDGFRFRDRQTGRSFCLSANGEDHGDCLKRFVGSIAIAHYSFRSRLQSPAPFNLRERVVTIDHDSRTSARPVFEKALPAEGGMISDIQAFGYDADEADREASKAQAYAPWSLMRQELYLNGETAEFLIVHWKHTVDLIRLVDVIPGDGVKLIG